jgi:hypothetical protein
MTPQHVIVEDEDDYEEEVLTNSMLETINVMEERDAYKSRLDTTESALSSAEKALSKSLAHEAQLRSELGDARALLSIHLDGADSNVNINRRRVGSATRNSPTPHRPLAVPHAASPTFHDRFDHFLPTSPTSLSRRGISSMAPSHSSPVRRNLFTNTEASSSRSEGPSELDVSVPTPTPHVIGALAEYYDFLNTKHITHLRTTLDVIRHNIPISLWATQLEKADVPLDLIDSIMVLMATAADN